MKVAGRNFFGNSSRRRSADLAGREARMTFGHPLWFWAFALLPVLLGIFFRNESRREKLLRQLVAAQVCRSFRKGGAHDFRSSPLVLGLRAASGVARHLLPQ